MLAEATGAAVISPKICVRSRTPSCRRSTANASEEGKGGTASCSWRSSSAYASGMRSVRIESACAAAAKYGCGGGGNEGGGGGGGGNEGGRCGGGSIRRLPELDEGRTELLAQV